MTWKPASCRPRVRGRRRSRGRALSSPPAPHHGATSDGSRRPSSRSNRSRRRSLTMPRSMSSRPAIAKRQSFTAVLAPLLESPAFRRSTGRVAASFLCIRRGGFSRSSLSWWEGERRSGRREIRGWVPLGCQATGQGGKIHALDQIERGALTAGVRSPGAVAALAFVVAFDELSQAPRSAFTYSGVVETAWPSRSR